MLKTVLQFYLRVSRETISRGDVDSFKVRTPVLVTTEAVADSIEQLLVPANRAKELRRKLVFCFDVISERVHISHVWHLESRLVQLCPNLQMMPRETGVLSKDEFPVIADIVPGRQCRFGFAPKIWSLAC